MVGLLIFLFPQVSFRAVSSTKGATEASWEDFLLVLHRNAQELEGFTPGAQDLLLLPGTLFSSVFGIILGYIVLNQGIQVIFLGQLEIALSPCQRSPFR